MGAAGLALFAALIVLVPACLAATCDGISLCEDCHALDHCSWCVVDGAGLCFPAEWGICNGEARTCTKTLMRRQAPENEDPALCQGFSLCNGATDLAAFLAQSQSPCKTNVVASNGRAVECKACFPGEDPLEWKCYAPDVVSPYDDGGFCLSGFALDTATLTKIHTAKCLPLIAAAPQIQLIAEGGQARNVPGGLEFINFIETTLNTSVFVLQSDGSFRLDLALLSADELETLKNFVVGLCNKAYPDAEITVQNVIILNVTIRPQNGKRGSLDNDLIQVQFALLKNDDPAGTDPIVQQIASGLAQGNIPGLDPLSVDVTPATEIVFNTAANSTTVPPSTDQVKARDPTSPLNGGAIFGIIFGSALFIVCVSAGIAYLFYRYRSSHRPPFDPARAT